MTSTDEETVRVLLLPGWLDSGPDHWQSRWEVRHGDVRVRQSDWIWPRRGDWMARLEETLLGDPRPAVLVAHSLGCQLVASWSAHTTNHHRVKAALLVAPPDTERDDMPPNLFNWRPIARRRLPFASRVVTSQDDPYGARERALGMASDWGADEVCIGARGHINGESGLGDWAQGRALLRSLIERAG